MSGPVRQRQPDRQAEDYKTGPGYIPGPRHIAAFDLPGLNLFLYLTHNWNEKEKCLVKSEQCEFG